jgi:sodium-dependent dicarboxylate transporter 2/3/5
MSGPQEPLQADDEGVTMPMTSEVVMSEEEEVQGSESSDSKHLADTKHLSESDLEDGGASSGGRIRLGICSVGLLIGFILCFIEIDGNRKINQTLAIAIWMASFWLTETIPLVVTAFLPIFLFPMFGIVSSGGIASQYMNNTILLFISGFLMALTLERWDIHRRFSLKILSICGTKPGSLLAGMMVSTFFLSMFVSNTATALMMVPNAVSVCESLERNTLPQFRHESRRFGIAMMLGIAYSANVGGLSSLIGTPPNLVFQRQLAILFPDSPEITFATWLGFGLPLGLVTAVIIWAYLCFMYLRNFKGENADRSKFIDEYVAMGAWSYEQIGVSLLFTLLAFLWIFRSDIVFSSFTIKGWSNIFPEPSFIADATIGFLIAIVLFVTPARPSKLPHAADDAEDKPTTTLLTWETANKMPYDIVFLFGGGYALAKGFVEGGLSAFLGEQLGNLDISLPGQVFLFLFVIIWLTELTSNTATSNIMIPIGASIAFGSMVSPYTFMIPAALACSCAFCLPIATPPNMVVFASGRLPLIEMNKAGVLLNLICSLLIFGVTFSIVPAVLDVGADEFPFWAENSPIGAN